MSAAIFLYLVDVLSSINVLCVLVGVAFLIGFVCFTGVYFVEHESYHHKNWPLTAAAVCLGVAALIPGKPTMYMMAASVVGEKALESEVGQQLQQMLKLKLEQEFQKMKDEVKK